MKRNSHERTLDVKKIDLQKNCYEVILFIAWCIFTLAGVLHHESWGDEVQAYLITRDLSIPGIFEMMKYEGHFMLWYLVLKPFSGLGGDFLPVISWGLSAAAYAIFLFYSPFSKAVKTAAIFSAPFLFWYPVVSRCYALFPLFLFITAIVFPKRKEKPCLFGIILALLANIHVIAEGLVFAIFLFTLYEAWKERKENKKLWLIPGLTFCGVSVAFLTVIRCLNSSESVRQSAFDILQIAYVFCMNLIGFDFVFTTGVPLSFAFAFSAVCGALFLILTKSKGFGLLFGIASLVFLVYDPLLAAVIIIYGILYFIVFDRKYPLFSAGLILALLCFWTVVIRFSGLLMQRSFFLYYVILFFGWLFHDYLFRENAVEARQFLHRLSGKLIPFLLLSVIGGVVILQQDLHEPFSGLRETGIFLNALPAGFQICELAKEDKLTLLTAWTKNKMKSLDTGTDSTFIMRNILQKRALDEIQYEDLLDATTKRVIVIRKDDSRIELLKKNSYEIIFSSQGTPCVSNESYFVFAHSSFSRELKNKMQLETN